MNLGMALLLLLPLSAQDDEAKKRDAFAKEFKEKAPATRVEAVGKMTGCAEGKSLAAIAAGLKDPVVDVKKAVANCLAECRDGGGAGITSEVLEILRLVDRLVMEAPPGDVFRQVEARWEKPLLRRVLHLTQGNQLKASELLGITRTTVKRKMDIHGL